MTETKTYQILKKLKILKSEKYSNVSLWKSLFIIPKKILDLLVYGYSYSFMLLEPLNYGFLRAKCWRFIGCRVGKNVNIGRHVEFDYGFPEKIVIEDSVILTHGCSLLCHKRDKSRHYVGNDPHTLPYIIKKITLKRYCQIGTNAMIMPGVTIGEGAVIGASSIVTKDIPDWCIAVGNPAKVVKQIKSKEYDNITDNK
jgi:acetyltransferase-like isoleucine patch superfamily enzyme